MQIVVNNTLLNYQVFGRKNTQPILILHGWARDSSDWIKIAQKLESKFQIILLDLPGFGASPMSKQTTNIQDYVNTTNKFISKLKIKKPIIMGHSFGGKIATIIASQNSDINKLVLISPSGVEEKTFFTKTRIFAAKAINLFPLSNNLKNTLRNSVASRDYKEAHELKEIFKKIVNQKVDHFATKITTPTLIIWGDKDKELCVKWSKKLKGLIKNSTLRIVWEAGHHPHLEKPDKFLEILNEFI